ncbi:MAG: hypothetical protein K8J08_22285, partial [Thermoanaerobaculia bacterium]|nr:hypothetical protein [Thermoanaerobaculia bacterium]
HALIVDSNGTQTVVTTISSTGSTNLALHTLGNVAFLGFLPGDDRFRVWSGPPGSIQAQLSVGSSAPGTVGSISELEDLAIISGARAVAAASLTTGQNAIFSDVGGSSRLVHESPLLLSGLSTDSYGHVAFIEDVGSSQTVFSEQGFSNLIALAEVGDQAPGMATGVEFFEFRPPIQNDFDQVVFAATLDGPGVGTSNDFSLWVFDPSVGLVAVARDGETIQIGPADTRTLQSFVFGFSSSLQDGAQMSFNRRGDIVFHAQFADGGSALLVANRQSAEIVFLDGFESGDLGAW